MIDLTLDYIKERELLLKEIEKLREERNQLRKVVMDADWMDLLDEKNKEIERLREVLQHIRSLATTPVRQIRLRSILEECVWFVNAALKEGE